MKISIARKTHRNLTSKVCYLSNQSIHDDSVVNGKQLVVSHPYDMDKLRSINSANLEVLQVVDKGFKYLE